MFEQNLRIGEQVVSASNESSGPYTVAPIENVTSPGTQTEY